MRKIIWNPLARQDYLDNLDFLLMRWSVKEAQAFIDRVAQIELLLAKGTVEFQNTDKKGVKKCVILKQITLYYCHPDINSIELLRFWNNSMDKRKFKI